MLQQDALNPVMVFASDRVLAVGAGAADSLPADLDCPAAVPHCRHRRGRRVRIDPGDLPFSRKSPGRALIPFVTQTSVCAFLRRRSRLMLQYSGVGFRRLPGCSSVYRPPGCASLRAPAGLRRLGQKNRPPAPPFSSRICLRACSEITSLHQPLFSSWTAPITLGLPRRLPGTVCRIGWHPGSGLYPRVDGRSKFRKHPWSVLLDRGDGAALRHFHAPASFYLYALAEQSGAPASACRVLTAVISSATIALLFGIGVITGVLLRSRSRSHRPEPLSSFA